MKVCSISLNDVNGTTVKLLLEQKNLAVKNFYNYNSPSLDAFTDDIPGLNDYIDSIYTEFDAFLEFPICLGFEHLYSKSPNVKFIYSKIDKASWIAKVNGLKTLFGGSSQAFKFEKLIANTYTNTGKEKIADLTDEELGEIFDAHEAAVESFFSDKNNLLIVDYNDSDLSSKIYTFLDI